LARRVNRRNPARPVAELSRLPGPAGAHQPERRKKMNVHSRKIAALEVTTGPIPGSRKVQVEVRRGLRVAMREVVITPESGEAPIALYDTSGPYTDPNAQIDLPKGLPPLRQPWILA